MELNKILLDKVKIVNMNSFSILNIKELSRIYKKIFEGAPWNEKWTLEESEKVILRYKNLVKENKGLFQTIFFKSKIIGFGVFLKNYNLDIITKKQEKVIYTNIVYDADFGIIPKFQNKGLGKLFMYARLNLLQNNSISEYYLRTINSQAIHLAKYIGSVKYIGKFNKETYENRYCYKVKIYGK